MRKNKSSLALVVASLFLATLWGCGSNMDSAGDQTEPGTTTTDAAKVGSSSCKVCHSAVVAQNFNGSFHDDDAVAGCEGCHGGGQFHKGIGPIPYPEPTLVQCDQCHDVTVKHIRGDDPATTTVIEGYTKVDDCLGCHSAKTPAVTTQWQHNPSSTDINKQWALSAHGGRIAAAIPDTATVWGHYNWDDNATRRDCQRCHTATGARNFLNNPTGYVAANNSFSHLSAWSATGGSPQNELLYCWGCHSDVANGALRNPGAITEVYVGSPTGSPTATVVYPDAFNSNVCMGCHLGREVGDVIKVSTGNFSNLSFINSHYLAAGGMVFGESGYEYAGQDYSKTFSGHASAGNTDGNGPCVTCHMTSSEPHKFEVVTKNAAGGITAVATTACGSCHGNMNAAWLEERKETFQEALDALKQALLAKGIEFSPNYPYFYVAGTTTAFKNWDGVNVGTVAAPITNQGKDVMGAAFNYNLLEHDPGAYTHNRSYALKLIADSIDFLADGLVDGVGTFTINAVTVDLLAVALTVEESTLDAKHFAGTVLVKAQYVAPATSFDAGGGACADCHTGGNTAANGVIIDQFAESAHGDVNGEAWWHYDWRASNRAACARCHNATAYVAKLGIESNTTWLYAAGDAGKAGEVLSCLACHTNLTTGAVRTPGVYTETYSDGATYTFPDIGKSNLCMRCHSGREAGSTIAADTDPDGDRSFINSHYLTAGGTVFATTGYEYAGKSYANVAFYAHNKIGIAVPGAPTATDAGPCAGCHMGTGTADHAWKVVAKDDAGVITAVNSNTCVNCHLGAFGLTVEFLKAEVNQYDAALDALKTLLDAKGIFFAPANPYFFTAPWVDYTPPDPNPNVAFTNWGGVATSLGLAAVPGYKDVMGAAFNYNLLYHDPGGYAHNRFYAKRLIFDSIDFIDNGILDGTISVTGDAALYLDGNSITAGMQRP